MKLETQNDQLMAMSAVAYCIGRRSYRRSYMVQVADEWVRENFEQLDRNAKRVILRDIIRALVQHTAGSRTDEPVWSSLARWMAERMVAEDLEISKGAVAYLGPETERYFPVEVVP
jgi:hypothetical protein